MDPTRDHCILVRSPLERLAATKETTRHTRLCHPVRGISPSAPVRPPRCLRFADTPAQLGRGISRRLGKKHGIGKDIPIQTSGSFPESSTGTLATRSIHSSMASVMWGTTCTVFPRYSPRRSRSCVGKFISGWAHGAAEAGVGSKTYDDELVDLAGCDVAVPAELDSEVPLIVAEIQVGLCASSAGLSASCAAVNAPPPSASTKHSPCLSMSAGECVAAGRQDNVLERTEQSCIGIEVWIDLDTLSRGAMSRAFMHESRG